MNQTLFWLSLPTTQSLVLMHKQTLDMDDNNSVFHADNMSCRTDSTNSQNLLDELLESVAFGKIIFVFVVTYIY